MACNNPTPAQAKQIAYQKALLNKIHKNETYSEAVISRNNGYPLGLNPDGTISLNAKIFDTLGYPEDTKIIRLANLYSDDFINKYNDKFKWFEDFDSINEPNLKIEPYYRHNAGTIINTDELLANVDETKVQLITPSITVVENVKTDSILTTYGNRSAATQLINNVITTYLRKVFEQRNIINKNEHYTTEAEFRSMGLSIDETDIKAIVVAELMKLAVIYKKSGNAAYTFIVNTIKDINVNTTEDNIYNEAKSELEKVLKAELNDTAINEEDENQRQNEASGQYMARLFDKSDHSSSGKSNINSDVKLLLMGIKSKTFDDNGNIVTEYNPLTGIPVLYSYNELLLLLRTKLSNIPSHLLDTNIDKVGAISVATVPQLIKVLNKIRQYMPFVNEVYDAVVDSNNTDGELARSMLYSMRNAQPLGIVTYIAEESIGLINSSNKLINTPNRFAISNKFTERLKLKIANNFFTAEKIAEIESLFKPDSRGNVSIDNIARIFQEFGMPFKPYQIKLINGDLIDFDSYAVSLFNSIKLYLDKQSTLSDTDLKSHKYADILSILPDERKNILGKINRLAIIISDFELSSFEANFINADGEKEYSIIDPTSLNDFIAYIHDSDESYEIKDSNNNRIGYVVGDEHKRFINNLLSDSKMRASVWLFNINTKLVNTNSQLYDENNNLITANITDDMYYSILRNLQDIEIFNYAGMKNVATGVKGKNSSLNTSDFLKSNILAYLDNIVILSESKDRVKVPLLAPSDSSSTLMFSQNRITPFNTEVLQNSDIKFNGHNMFYKEAGGFKFNEKENNITRFELRKSFVAQELARMLQDRELMFDGHNNLKPEFADDRLYDLQENEHFTTYKNKQGKRVTGAVDDNGKVTGRTFQFHIIPELNNIFSNYGLIDIHTGLISRNANSFLNHIYTSKFTENEQLIMNEIDKAIINELQKEVDRLDKLLKPNKTKIINKLIKNNKFTNSKNDNLLYNVTKGEGLYKGFLIEYAINTKVANNEQLLLFQGTLSAHKNNLDVNKRAKKWTSPGKPGTIIDGKRTLNMAIINDVTLKSTYIAALAKHQTKNKALLTNKQIDVLDDMYKGIDIADAEGYITPNGYANLLRSFGLFSKFSNYFTINKETNKYELKKDLPYANLLELMSVIKPFYANHHYIAKLKKFTSIQVKDSLVLLIPEFIKGTQLEQLHDEMNRQNIEHVVMKSAIKNGIHNVNHITDNNGNILADKLSNLKIVELDRRFFRNQVEVVNHHKDTTIKAGIQIFKLILSDISDNSTFNYNNKTITGAELKRNFHTIISNVVTKNAESVNIRVDKLYNSNNTINNEEVSKLLKELGGDLLSIKDKNLIAIDENGNFKLPLDLINKQRFESLINSVFTKNIIDTKVPGMHSTFVSNAFMNTPISDKGLDLSQIRNFASDKLRQDTAELDSYYDKDLNKWVVEAYVNVWSKDFYGTDGQQVDINTLSKDIRTMLAYRIPTSARHSAVVVKVVGFLPEYMGSVIVMPYHIIARTGADFDIDSFYINRKPHLYNEAANQFEAIPYRDIMKDEYNYEDFKDNVVKDKIKYEDYIFNKFLYKSKYKQLLNEINNNAYNEIHNLKSIHSEYNDLTEEQIQLLFEDNDRVSEQFKYSINKLHNSNITLHRLKQEKINITNEITNIQTGISKGYIDTSETTTVNTLLQDRRDLNVKLRLLGNTIVDIQKELDYFKQTHKDNNDIIFKDYISSKDLQKEIDDIINNRDKEREELFNDMVDEFIAQGKEKYHETSVMLGEVLEIMNTVMSDDELIYGNTLTAEFNNTKEESNFVNDLYENVDLNPTNISTQLILRERGFVGKEVLGIFANSNTGLTILQNIEAEIHGNDIIIPYELDDVIVRYNKKNKTNLSEEELMKLLQNKYKNSLSYKEGRNKFYVTYTKIGHNEDGSFTNILNEPILAEYGKLVDHAPDNMKDPLPRNITPFSTNAILATSIGGDVTYGVRMIEQEGVSTLLKYDDNNLNNYIITNLAKKELYTKILDIIHVYSNIGDNAISILSSDKPYEGLDNINFKVLNRLLDTNDLTKFVTFLENIKTVKLDDKYLNMFNQIKKGKEVPHTLNDKGNWTINNELDTVNKWTKYNTKDEKKIGTYTTTPLTYRELGELLKTEADIKTNKVIDINKFIEYYLSQIDMIDRFNDFNERGKHISTYINMLNADKKGLGQSINDNANYVDNILLFDTSVNVSNKNSLSIITNKEGYNKANIIDAIYTVRNDIANFSTPVKEKGSDYSSIYPILNTYFVNGNLNGLVKTKDLFRFHIANPIYNSLFTIVQAELGLYTAKERKVLESNLNRVIGYNLITSNSNIYNDKNRVLGINIDADIEMNDKLVLKTKSKNYNDNLEIFNTLPLANKILLYKAKHDISNENPLFYIEEELSRYNILRNNHMNVAPIDISREDELIAKIQQLTLDYYNSNDEFMKSIIDDMIKFNVYKYGLQGGYGSFNYMFHNDILSNDKYGIHTAMNRFNNSINIQDIANSTISLLAVRQTPYVITTNELSEYANRLWYATKEGTVFKKYEISNNFQPHLTNSNIRKIYNTTTKETRFYSIKSEINEKSGFSEFIVKRVNINSNAIDLSLDSLVEENDNGILPYTAIDEGHNTIKSTGNEYNRQLDAMANILNKECK